MIRRLKISLLLIIITSQIFAGTVYYVDATNGNDSYPGTSEGQAWKTLAKVSSEMNGGVISIGDDVYFKRGETWSEIGQDCLIRNGGTSGDRMIIGAYGSGDKPLFDDCYFKINAGIDYITVENLQFQNVSMASGNYYCVGARGENDLITNIIVQNIQGTNCKKLVSFKGVDTFTVDNCHLQNSDGAGMSGIGILGSLNNKCANGTISNCTVNGTNDCFTLHNDGEGNPIGSNFIISNCQASGSDEQGIDLTSGSNITVTGCETYNNTQGGIVCGHGVRDVTIERHYSLDEKSTGIILSRSLNVKLTNSIIYNSGFYSLNILNCKNLKVYNNTIVNGQNSSSSIIRIAPVAQNVTFKNNIIISLQHNKPRVYMKYSNGATPQNTNSDFSHNVWWGLDLAADDDRLWYDDEFGRYNFDTWKFHYNQGEGSMLIDPKLINPDAKDFHLWPTSPCIDAAINVGLDCDFERVPIPQGIAPDIGAYEYVIRKKKKRMIMFIYRYLLLHPETPQILPDSMLLSTTASSSLTIHSSPLAFL